MMAASIDNKNDVFKVPQCFPPSNSDCDSGASTTTNSKMTLRKRRKINYLDDDNQSFQHNKTSTATVKRKASSSSNDVYDDDDSCFGLYKVYDRYGDDDLDYDNDEELDLQLGDFSSQNNGSLQMSQILLQLGQFTYYDIIQLPKSPYSQKHIRGRQHILQSLGNDVTSTTTTVIFDPDCSIFSQLRQQLSSPSQWPMAATTFVESFHLFSSSPSSLVLDLPREYLRMYPKLTLDRLQKLFTGCYTASHLAQTILKLENDYLQFWFTFFRLYASNQDLWPRHQLMQLLHWPKREANHSDFLFNLIKHIMSVHLRLNKITTDKDELQKSSKQNLKNSKNKSTFVTHSQIQECINFGLPCQLLQLIVHLLECDFEHYLKNSTNYMFDIKDEVRDSKPLLVRLFWSARSPDYLCAMVKHFVAYLAAAIRFRINPLVSELMRVYDLIGESLRIGTGNIRPYLDINSTRLTLAHELFLQLEKEGHHTNWSVIQLLLTQCKPWLALQLVVQQLNRFVGNLSSHLTTITGVTINGSIKRKYRLSLRLLLFCYFDGDVDQYKYNMAEMAASQSKLLFVNDNQTLITADQSSLLKLKKDCLSRKLVDRDKELKCEEYLGAKSKAALDHMYRRYNVGGNSEVTQLTTFGGNSLHIACRRGDADWIESLYDLVDPNLPDSKGYTPLHDAVRFGHHHCVEALCRMATETGLLLNFESADYEHAHTPLHHAALVDDIQMIELLLTNGGKHLLKLRTTIVHNNQKVSVTAEELFTTETAHYVATNIRFDHRNIVPKFETDEQLHLYANLVANAISLYIKTIKLEHFFRYCTCEERHTLLQAVDNWQAVSAHFQRNFSDIFCRNCSDTEVNTLIDDLSMCSQVEIFMRRFAVKHGLLLEGNNGDADKETKKQKNLPTTEQVSCERYPQGKMARIKIHYSDLPDYFRLVLFDLEPFHMIEPETEEKKLQI